MEHFDVINQGEEVQIRTKNELLVVEFDDEDKRQIFDLIANKYAAQSGKKLFNALFLRNLERKYGKEKVLTVLEELRDFNILPQPLYRYVAQDDEVPENGDAKKNAAPPPKYALTEVKLLILASEYGAQVLKQKAEPLKFKNLEVKTFSKNWDKASAEKAIAHCDFMIVEASQWNPEYLQWINSKALSRNLPWLLIEGLNLNKIKIGPIMQGRETACYNCLVKRQQSNRDEDLLPYDEQYEAFLTQNGLLSKPDQSLFSPAQLYDIMASMALLEITKFFKYWAVPALWGHCVTLDVFTFAMDRHKVLKVPHCPSCKPKLEYNSAPWLEAIALKHE